MRAVQDVLTVVFVLYVPYYLYRAMRTGVRARTLRSRSPKFSLLGIGYLCFMTLTAVGLLFYTALTL